MAIVSDIEIRLMANIAELQQNMASARRTVDNAMGGISRAAGVAKVAIGALAGVLSVGAFAGWIKGAIDATDAVADISVSSGIAIKDIAALQLAFKKGGMEATDMQGSMVKLSKAIAAGDDSFKRIGVATAESNGALRSSKDVLYDVADAFAGLEDGTAKTALAIDIFGKSGAAMIPLLNDGSQGLRDMADMADKLGLTFDEKTVKAAGDFNDTLDFMGLAGQGVARKVSAELLPTLNSLAGSFLTLITQGDGVRKAADAIGVVFKSLFTIGVGVTEVFNTVGSTIGAAAAQMIAVLQGDFKTAVGIGQAWSKDMVSSWSASAKAISDTWTGAGGEAVAAMAGIEKKSGVIAEKVSKDAKKQADAFTPLLSSIRARVAESEREALGLVPLNAAQKIALQLDEDLATGKIKLTAAQVAQVRAQIELYEVNLNAIESQKAYAKMQDDLAKARERYTDEQEQGVRKAQEEAEANEKLRDTFGQTQASLAALDVARLESQLAQRTSMGLTLDEVEYLERLIDAKKRSAKALADVDDMRAQKDMWESIEKTAHDTFVSIIDGGKDAATRLKDTFKNVFFDWLYQQTLKKWVINLSGTASLSGASGLAQAAGAAGGAGSSLSMAAGSAGSLAGIAGLLGSAGSIGTGALQTAGALLSGNIGFGSTLSAGLSAVGTGSAAGVSAGLSSIVGTIAPVAIAAVLGSVLLKKAFGRGPKETTAQGIEGTFGADSFSGNKFTEWVKKGGWFRSDKRGVDTAALDEGTAGALNDSYKALKDNTLAFAAALGQPTEQITGYTKAIKLALTGDATKDQKLITDLFVQMGDELAARVVPNIGQFIAQGETAAATLQRLATNFTNVNSIFDVLNVDVVKAFGAVGIASLEARERLLAFAGGTETLAAQTGFFTENFLSEAERMAPVQKVVTEQLAALGYAGITTSDQFKVAVLDLANSGALATEAGAKTYAGLLALAPAFKTLSDYLVVTKKAADDAAAAAKAEAEEKAAAAAAAQVDSLRTAVGDTFAALQRAVGAHKDRITTSFNDLMARLDGRIQASTKKIAGLQELSGLLAGASTGATTAAAQQANRQQGQAQILAALAIAKSSGVLPSADSIRGALQAVASDAAEQFSTFEDYQRDQLLTSNSIRELGGITGTQLSVAERTLAALQDQKTAAQAAYSAEVARLDEMVNKAQMQVDAINGVNVSVLTQAQAFSEFAASVMAALKNPTITGQSSVTGRTQIESLYNSVLGRTSDSGGLDYWTKMLKSGMSLGDIEGAFRTSEEYRARYGSVYSTQSSGTMTAGENAIVSQMQTMNSRLESVEAATNSTAVSSGQFAQQFNTVTQGGGALLTEAA